MKGWDFMPSDDLVIKYIKHFGWTEHDDMMENVIGEIAREGDYEMLEELENGGHIAHMIMLGDFEESKRRLGSDITGTITCRSRDGIFPVSRNGKFTRSLLNHFSSWVGVNVANKEFYGQLHEEFSHYAQENQREFAWGGHLRVTSRGIETYDVTLPDYSFPDLDDPEIWEEFGETMD